MTQMVLIALGANIGDRRQTLIDALRHIGERVGPIVDVSHFYETAPIGNADQIFLNGAAVVSTALAPDLAMRELLEIERRLGRERSLHWGNRTLDLDIILWRDSAGHGVVHHSEMVTIPHPQARHRDFVLVPAAEIAGAWIMPNLAQEINEVVAERGFALVGQRIRLEE